MLYRKPRLLNRVFCRKGAGNRLFLKSGLPATFVVNRPGQAYHRWIRDALKENRPYDWFARELLTSSGTNFRVPPVNFYRAVQGREPSAPAEAVALTLMGARLASRPEDQRTGMAAFFSRVAYKKTDEWKQEVVYLDLELAE